MLVDAKEPENGADPAENRSNKNDSNYPLIKKLRIPVLHGKQPQRSGLGRKYDPGAEGEPNDIIADDQINRCNDICRCSLLVEQHK